LRLAWLDALTPKQAQLMAWLARRLAGAGFRVLLTVRSYDYTVGVAGVSGVEAIVVGGYGGGSLEGKLRASAERILGLAGRVGGACVAVMYPSPSGARTAYGLGIPLIVLSDSPHSVPAHRLAVPLSDYLVHSSFIPGRLFERYVLGAYTRRLTYRGFDELEYIAGYRPSRRVLGELGLEEYGYVVVRPPEYKAAYYHGRRRPEIERLVEKITGMGYRVVYLPRYPEQAEAVKGMRGVIVPERAVKGLDLEAWAAAVVTGGASMAREAALLGTPGISLYPGRLHVDEAVERLGAPLHHAGSPMDAWRILREVLRSPEKHRRCMRGVLGLLEKPSDIVIPLAERACKNT